MSLSLRSGAAMIGGDVATDFSSTSDSQLEWSYYLEDTGLLIHAGINAPTGRQKLTTDEFATTYLVSLHYYNFQTPNFGQGWNVVTGSEMAMV